MFSFYALWLQSFAKDRFSVNIFQLYSHVCAVLVDVDVAVELESAEGRQILCRRRLLENHFGAEGIVQFAGAETASI